jgi:hypothetical protein
VPQPTTRFAAVREALSGPWRAVLYLYGGIAFYDLALSQLVPEEWAKRAPKTWQVAVLTGNLLPWWGWAIGLLVIALAAMTEYAFRRAHGAHKPQPPPSRLGERHAAAAAHMEHPTPQTDAVVAHESSRIFVSASVTPAYLIGLFKEHTSFQAKKLIEQYLGKWMPITGLVHDTNPTTTFSFSDPQQIAQLFIFEEGRLLTARFNESWVDRIAILRRGDKVSFIGKIADVNAMAIDLDDCELVVAN